MIYRAYKPSESPEIKDLFTAVFSNSEGEQEGLLIGNLVRQMMTSTDPADLYGFVAAEGPQIVGSIFFSRLIVEGGTDVFLLAPAAVDPNSQGQGIGQALINFGLQELKEDGVSFVATCGDPAYYSKVGFHQISPDKVAPPLELSQPEGWLGQTLIGEEIEGIAGKSACIAALNNQTYW